jgi:hypothetical protein
MKLLNILNYFKTFLIFLIVHSIHGNELWIGTDAGVGFTKFINFDDNYFKAKMRPGFLSGINFFHKPFKVFSINYRIGYNQQRPAFIDENEIPVTKFNKETGEIDSTGEVMNDSHKFSLNTVDFFIQPIFYLLIQKKRFGLCFGPGIGVVYRFKVNQYSENFGNPVEISYTDNYNKIDIPIIGSICILYKINEKIQLLLNNKVYFGTKTFFEKKANDINSPSFFYNPSLKMASYQVMIGVNYRFYSSI